jgi:hypothetical protein
MSTVDLQPNLLLPISGIHLDFSPGVPSFSIRHRKGHIIVHSSHCSLYCRNGSVKDLITDRRGLPSHHRSSSSLPDYFCSARFFAALSFSSNSLKSGVSGCSLAPRARSLSIFSSDTPDQLVSSTCCVLALTTNTVCYHLAGFILPVRCRGDQESEPANRSEAHQDPSTRIGGQRRSLYLWRQRMEQKQEDTRIERKQQCKTRGEVLGTIIQDG